MKSIFQLLLLASVTLTAHAADIRDATGIKDACVAGTLLDANRVSYRVVIFHSASRDEAGCIYRANGDSYLYTPMGSAKINPAELQQVPLENVSRAEVFHIADGDTEIRNGCLVYATATYSQYKRNPHITWAGIIAARVVNINNIGSDGDGRFNMTGHAITAYENDKREVFIQENGGEPKKLDNMTRLAQSGDKTWHDSSTLVYCDHHIQGIAAFAAEFGRPL